MEMQESGPAYDENLFSDVSDDNDPPYVPESSDYIDDSDDETSYCNPMFSYISTDLTGKSKANCSTTEASALVFDSNQQQENIRSSTIDSSCQHPFVSSFPDSEDSNIIPLSVPEKRVTGVSHDIIEQQTISGLKANKGPTKLDKQHYCLFCETPQTKLKRHLVKQHSDESEMLPFHTATKSQKKAELAKLRNLGNFQHNKKVLKEGKGKLVVKRKRKKGTETSKNDFVPCKNCLGFFLKQDIWRHQCPVQGTSKKGLAKSGRVLLDDSSGDTILCQILESLRHDNVAIVAKNDGLIKLLAQRESRKNGWDKDRHNYIRNKLREMARFLLVLRKKTKQESASLSELLTPEHFNDIVQATKEVAGYSESSSTYERPSLAKKIGHSLVKCSLLLKAKALEIGDSNLKKQCEEYHQVHEIRWEEEISTQAQRTLYQSKKNQTSDMPLLEDVKQFISYLDTEGVKTRQMLDDTAAGLEIKKVSWERLAEITLCHIIMFNRRRQGEASKMKLHDALNGIENSSNIHNDDVLQGLSKLEQGLCQIFTLIEITGKRGRTVPVLLTANMKASVVSLIKFRDIVGVNQRNPFLFARRATDSQHHIRGSDCIRKLVQSPEIGLQKPDRLRSTLLRKHLASMTQLVNLKDNELDILAQFMGHDVRVHRDFYRLPTATVQVAKVSKILMAMSKDGKLDEANEDDGSDESDFEAEALVEQNTETENIVEQSTSDQASLHQDPDGNSHARQSSKDVKRNMSGRRKWDPEEEAACRRYFARHIILKKLPGKNEIIKVQEKEPNLEQRTWIQIKNFIRNLIKKC